MQSPIVDQNHQQVSCLPKYTGSESRAEDSRDNEAFVQFRVAGAGTRKTHAPRDRADRKDFDRAFSGAARVRGNAVEKKDTDKKSRRQSKTRPSSDPAARREPVPGPPKTGAGRTERGGAESPMTL
ncbi:hypothetical protein EYF80_017909 [Liparis tanakae]|uniref:Uncharacterized protein n=1 Tax=Liparis tanakae TaxID=230148 RepID=A0A4Z2I3Q4_9TELE|nr:hypothetical protein EYF80_017909 [Liparis tanakae]